MKWHCRHVSLLGAIPTMNSRLGKAFGKWRLLCALGRVIGALIVLPRYISSDTSLTCFLLMEIGFLVYPNLMVFLFSLLICRLTLTALVSIYDVWTLLRTSFNWSKTACPVWLLFDWRGPCCFRSTLLLAIRWAEPFVIRAGQLMLGLANYVAGDVLWVRSPGNIVYKDILVS